MAHSLSAKKRIRQNKKRMLRNRVRREHLKQSIKGFHTAIASGSAEAIQAELNKAQKAYDCAKDKGIVHRKNADRHKSRLALAANRALQASS